MCGIFPSAANAGMGRVDKVSPRGLDIPERTRPDRYDRRPFAIVRVMNGAQRVPTNEIPRQVNERLDALYRRVSAAGDEDVERYYPG